MVAAERHPAKIAAMHQKSPIFQVSMFKLCNEGMHEIKGLIIETEMYFQRFQYAQEKLSAYQKHGSALAPLAG